MSDNVLTSSRLRDTRLCQRLHRYRYVDGFRPVEQANALSFGSLIHCGLEAWWSEPEPKGRLAAALGALTGEVDLYDLARAVAILTGYDARWRDEPLRAVGVEVQFRANLRNPSTGVASRTWDLAGKIDVIVQDDQGRILLVEHKTTSEDMSPGSTYWARLRIDGQISVYFEGAKALGLKVDACLYDVLGKPALRPYRATPPEAKKYTKGGVLYKTQREQDETPEEFRERLLTAIAEDPSRYYQRGEVVRLEGETEEALHEVWQLGRQIREAELAGRYPRNPDACFHWGRMCSFFPVCTGEASLTDETRYRKTTSIHEELTDGDASEPQK